MWYGTHMTTLKEVIWHGHAEGLTKWERPGIRWIDITTKWITWITTGIVYKWQECTKKSDPSVQPTTTKQWQHSDMTCLIEKQKKNSFRLKARTRCPPSGKISLSIVSHQFHLCGLLHISRLNSSQLWRLTKFSAHWPQSETVINHKTVTLKQGTLIVYSNDPVEM